MLAQAKCFRHVLGYQDVVHTVIGFIQLRHIGTSFHSLESVSLQITVTRKEVERDGLAFPVAYKEFTILDLL